MKAPIALQLAMLLALIPLAARPAPRYQPSPATLVPGQPYESYSTKDRFGRQIQFYVSTSKGVDLPVVLYIEGSGCGSRFESAAGKIRPEGGHIVVANVFKDKARVVVVEKPGVTYLSQPSDGCRDQVDFNREHSLQKWAEANEAALLATYRIASVGQQKTLVIGHSEGGLVAARVARELPGHVGHVATIAGGGPSQLFDLVSLARSGTFFNDVSSDPERRADYVLGRWRDILENPTATDKFFFGFTYLRWASFLSSSPIDELSGTKARIYIAQGTADTAVDPASADALYAQLRSKKKDVVLDRVAGASHSFRLKDQPEVDGWQALFKRISRWFLDDS